MIEIKDLDIIIPVKINLETSLESQLDTFIFTLNFLEKRYKTNIYILEYSKKPYLWKLISKANYYCFYNDNDGTLTKGRVINNAFNSTTNKIFCVYDYNYLIRDFQFITSIKLLLEEKVDVVIPYNGMVLNLLDLQNLILRDNFLETINYLDYQISKYSSKERVFFISRKFFSYIKGFNENITEDTQPEEFWNRLNKLEGIVGQIVSPIYYINLDKSYNLIDSYFKKLKLDICKVLDPKNEDKTVNNNLKLSKEEYLNLIKKWNWIKE